MMEHQPLPRLESPAPKTEIGNLQESRLLRRNASLAEARPQLPTKLLGIEQRGQSTSWRQAVEVVNQTSGGLSATRRKGPLEFPVPCSSRHLTENALPFDVSRSVTGGSSFTRGNRTCATGMCPSMECPGAPPCPFMGDLGRIRAV